MSYGTVFGTYGAREQVEAAVEQMKAEGFQSRDISVLFPHSDGSEEPATEAAAIVPERAATGAASGAVIGGALGWLAGIGVLAIPGIGPFIAAGPLMGILTGAGVGATVGGLTGALVGLGMHEDEAKRYEGLIEAGNVVVSIHIHDDGGAENVKALLRRTGAGDIVSTADVIGTGA